MGKAHQSGSYANILTLVQSESYWVLGNGKKIKFWSDRILGNPSISSLPHMDELSNWEIGNGLVTLYDLSSWDRKGKWIGWKLLQPPDHLKQAANLLLALLRGIAPISKSSKDSIGWGSNGTYN